MLSTPQFENFSVWDHGMDVHAWYLDLYLHLTAGKPLQLQWRLPDWAKSPAITANLLPLETMRLYQLYHDCGKPHCRTVDADGRQHFPNHAEVSYETWMRYAETPEDGQVGELIRMDMLAHTVKGEAVDAFIRHPEAPSLLLTALAEIHSNASQLGQLGGDNFKIKLKQLAKVGKRIVAEKELAPV
jgi:hypothetical protein